MENLGINGKLLIAQIVNFLLFFILIRRFIAKPFMKFLDQEKEKDKEKEEALNKIKKIENKLLVQEQELKEKSKKELDAVLAQAKKDGRELRDDMLKQAETDAEEVKIRMKKQLDEEREKLYKDVRQKIGDVSIHLVNEGLKDALDVDMKRKVTEKILKNLSSQKIN